MCVWVCFHSPTVDVTIAAAVKSWFLAFINLDYSDIEYNGLTLASVSSTEKA